MHSLNFGISGDRTENVLWRLQNGELENLSPKVNLIFCYSNIPIFIYPFMHFQMIVLSVGQENYGDTPEKIAEGLQAICSLIRSKQPQAFLIVLVGCTLSTTLHSLLINRPSCQEAALTAPWGKGTSRWTRWWPSMSRGTVGCSLSILIQDLYRWDRFWMVA